MFRLVSTVRAPRIGAQNADQIKIADFNGDRRPDIFGIDNGIDKMPFTGGRTSFSCPVQASWSMQPGTFLKPC